MTPVTPFELELMEEITEYRKIIPNMIYFARRYADNRDTYTPEMVEEAIAKCAELKLFIDDDHTLENKRWKKDE